MAIRMTAIRMRSSSAHAARAWIAVAAIAVASSAIIGYVAASGAPAATAAGCGLRRSVELPVARVPGARTAGARTAERVPRDDWSRALRRSRARRGEAAVTPAVDGRVLLAASPGSDAAQDGESAGGSPFFG